MNTVSAWRLLLAMAVLVLLAGGVAARVVYLQSEEERGFLKRQGDARTIRTLSIQPARGVIYDRRGEPLAVSTPVASIWVNPQRFDTQHPAVTDLAELLGYQEQALRERIARHGRREFVYLRRQVTLSRAEEIAALGIRGVESQDEYKRFYPAGEVAAHLVGLTNIDDQGIEGLELAYDRWLRGTPGRKRVQRDRHGRVIRDLEYLATAEAGKDLHLAMDLRLQYLAYRELGVAMRETRAKSGTIVVMDATTGEILAMVNQPGYNPNAPVTAGYDRLRNRALTDLYEPGSTVKPFTIAAALESGRFQADAVIDTAPGWMRVAGNLITDPINRGELSLEQIIARSSQVGITRVALDLEEELLRDMFARFGLGEPTGMGFPGETSGVLPVGGRWPLIDRVTFAFGYGLAVTPVQMVQAYAGLANGGAMRAPTLLRVEQPEPAHQVLDPAIAAALTGMLESVVHDEGTAARARVAGHRVAGKTGTVRKVGADGSYDAARHIAFFAGFAPVEAPRVVAVVVINEPRGERTGGGQVAAPVFARVVEGALRLLSVAPELSSLGTAEQPLPEVRS